ncbi:MAG TPA: ribose-5-phosphate isomerase RpiA [Thermotogota bacterium]|nr:ribose-5-phosphate isomerase RpiA [Thermotogota bacterium]HPJ87980.1 ribose-5-phosphate isomerase RpiA [Thermotogota bacterium]HPR95067.1 ribose-5-phosphate isomerase RpiA [Thermotogota bacterium]
MNIKEELKKFVAQKAMDFVKNNMTIGLGSGSTMVYVIDEIGKKIKSGELKNISGVPTSFQSSILGMENGINMLDFNSVKKIDLAIDGADEIDPSKYLIKGGGGAHTREKFIDYYADKFIVVADESKLVDSLGSTFPVPVEVLPEAYVSVQYRLKKMGGTAILRMAMKKAGPVITDQGNFILDTTFETINNPRQMEKEINNIPGVLENGLFTREVEAVLIGSYKEGNMNLIRL